MIFKIYNLIPFWERIFEAAFTWTALSHGVIFNILIKISTLFQNNKFSKISSLKITNSKKYFNILAMTRNYIFCFQTLMMQIKDGNQ